MGTVTVTLTLIINKMLTSRVMFSLISLGLASAAPQLPAGLTAAACPNYPYCDAVTGFLEVPDVPGAKEVLLRANLAPSAVLPGADAHAAAEAAIQELSRPGFNEHAAAEAAVLFAQGRAPANLSPGELAHYQAEQAVLAAQQHLLVQG